MATTHLENKFQDIIDDREVFINNFLDDIQYIRRNEPQRTSFVENYNKWSSQFKKVFESKQSIISLVYPSRLERIGSTFIVLFCFIESIRCKNHSYETGLFFSAFIAMIFIAIALFITFVGSVDSAMRKMWNSNVLLNCFLARLENRLEETCRKYNLTTGHKTFSIIPNCNEVGLLPKPRKTFTSLLLNLYSIYFDIYGLIFGSVIYILLYVFNTESMLDIEPLSYALMLIVLFHQLSSVIINYNKITYTKSLLKENITVLSAWFKHEFFLQNVLGTGGNNSVTFLYLIDWINHECTTLMSPSISYLITVISVTFGLPTDISSKNLKDILNCLFFHEISLSKEELHVKRPNECNDKLPVQKVVESSRETDAFKGRQSDANQIKRDDSRVIQSHSNNALESSNIKDHVVEKSFKKSQSQAGDALEPSNFQNQNIEKIFERSHETISLEHKKEISTIKIGKYCSLISNLENEEESNDGKKLTDNRVKFQNNDSCECFTEKSKSMNSLNNSIFLTTQNRSIHSSFNQNFKEDGTTNISSDHCSISKNIKSPQNIKDVQLLERKLEASTLHDPMDSSREVLKRYQFKLKESKHKQSCRGKIEPFTRKDSDDEEYVLNNKQPLSKDRITVVEISSKDDDTFNPIFEVTIYKQWLHCKKCDTLSTISKPKLSMKHSEIMENEMISEAGSKSSKNINNTYSSQFQTNPVHKEEDTNLTSFIEGLQGTDNIKKLCNDINEKCATSSIESAGNDDLDIKLNYKSNNYENASKTRKGSESECVSFGQNSENTQNIEKKYQTLQKPLLQNKENTVVVDHDFELTSELNLSENLISSISHFSSKTDIAPNDTAQELTNIETEINEKHQISNEAYFEDNSYGETLNPSINDPTPVKHSPMRDSYQSFNQTPVFSNEVSPTTSDAIEKKGNIFPPDLHKNFEINSASSVMKNIDDEIDALEQMRATEDNYYLGDSSTQGNEIPVSTNKNVLKNSSSIPSKSNLIVATEEDNLSIHNSTGAKINSILPTILAKTSGNSKNEPNESNQNSDTAKYHFTTENNQVLNGIHDSGEEESQKILTTEVKNTECKFKDHDSMLQLTNILDSLAESRNSKENFVSKTSLSEVNTFLFDRKDAFCAKNENDPQKEEETAGIREKDKMGKGQTRVNQKRVRPRYRDEQNNNVINKTLQNEKINTFEFNSTSTQHENSPAIKENESTKTNDSSFLFPETSSSLTASSFSDSDITRENKKFISKNTQNEKPTPKYDIESSTSNNAPFLFTGISNFSNAPLFPSFDSTRGYKKDFSKKIQTEKPTLENDIKSSTLNNAPNFFTATSNFPKVPLFPNFRSMGGYKEDISRNTQNEKLILENDIKSSTFNNTPGLFTGTSNFHKAPLFPNFRSMGGYKEDISRNTQNEKPILENDIKSSTFNNDPSLFTGTSNFHKAPLFPNFRSMGGYKEDISRSTQNEKPILKNDIKSSIFNNDPILFAGNSNFSKAPLFPNYSSMSDNKEDITRNIQNEKPILENDVKPSTLNKTPIRFTGTFNFPNAPLLPNFTSMSGYKDDISTNTQNEESTREKDSESLGFNNAPLFFTGTSSLPKVLLAPDSDNLKEIKKFNYKNTQTEKLYIKKETQLTELNNSPISLTETSSLLKSPMCHDSGDTDENNKISTKNESENTFVETEIKLLYPNSKGKSSLSINKVEKDKEISSASTSKTLSTAEIGANNSLFVSSEDGNNSSFKNKALKENYGNNSDIDYLASPIRIPESDPLAARFLENNGNFLSNCADDKDKETVVHTSHKNDISHHPNADCDPLKSESKKNVSSDQKQVKNIVSNFSKTSVVGTEQNKLIITKSDKIDDQLPIPVMEENHLSILKLIQDQQISHQTEEFTPKLAASDCIKSTCDEPDEKTNFSCKYLEPKKRRRKIESDSELENSSTKSQECEAMIKNENENLRVEQYGENVLFLGSVLKTKECSIYEKIQLNNSQCKEFEYNQEFKDQNKFTDTKHKTILHISKIYSRQNFDSESAVDNIQYKYGANSKANVHHINEKSLKTSTYGTSYYPQSIEGIDKTPVKENDIEISKSVPVAEQFESQDKDSTTGEKESVSSFWRQSTIKGYRESKCLMTDSEDESEENDSDVDIFPKCQAASITWKSDVDLSGIIRPGKEILRNQALSSHLETSVKLKNYDSKKLMKKQPQYTLHYDNLNMKLLNDPSSMTLTLNSLKKNEKSKNETTTTPKKSEKITKKTPKISNLSDSNTLRQIGLLNEMDKKVTHSKSQVSFTSEFKYRNANCFIDFHIQPDESEEVKLIPPTDDSKENEIDFTNAKPEILDDNSDDKIVGGGHNNSSGELLVENGSNENDINSLVETLDNMSVSELNKDGKNDKETDICFKTKDLELSILPNSNKMVLLYEYSATNSSLLIRTDSKELCLETADD